MCRQRVHCGEVATVTRRTPSNEESGSIRRPTEDLLPVAGSWGTKIESVVRLIKHERMKNESNPDGPSKFLVFSRWNKILTVMTQALVGNGIRTLHLDGTRDKVNFDTLLSDLLYQSFL